VCQQSIKERKQKREGAKYVGWVDWKKGGKETNEEVEERQVWWCTVAQVRLEGETETHRNQPMDKGPANTVLHQEATKIGIQQGAGGMETSRLTEQAG
jgi:hypothetical protein